MAQLEFLFDFGSPNAYLAHRRLQQMREAYLIDVTYTPILLGGLFKATGNQPPWLAFSEVPPKMNYLQTEMQRYVRRYGLNGFTFNPNFPIITLLLMRGAIAAQERGEFETYFEAGLAAMWENGKKMDDKDTFVDVFNAAGLDGAALLAATQDQSVKDKLIANTNTAVERGVFGIPTFFFNDELYFGKESLREIKEDLS